jgi:hypothetical protein
MVAKVNVTNKNVEESVMNSASAPGERPEKRRAQVELDRRYGRIGISALAAALRYQGDGKNPAYAAPVGPREEQNSIKVAVA